MMQGMNQAPFQQPVEDAMDSIDVHDLPEEQAQLVAAFVEFLRQQQREAAGQERDWAAGAATSFAVVVSIDAFEQATGDFTVAMITSVPHTTAYDYELLNWQAAHLLRPSWVRAKLATLDPALVRHHPGRLSDADLTEVERRIRLALGLS
jgi:hypothetical protein